MARIEDNSNKRKYRIISWPLFLLTFIPNFCMALIIYSEDHTITIVSEKLLKIILNSNIWQPAFGIGMIITMVWSIIERGFKGIGIGLLRVLINISIPVIITWEREFCRTNKIKANTDLSVYFICRVEHQSDLFLFPLIPSLPVWWFYNKSLYWNYT